jgi:hypothetical protein
MLYELSKQASTVSSNMSHIMDTGDGQEEHTTSTTMRAPRAFALWQLQCNHAKTRST